MNPVLSIWLDASRILAAFAVFLGHAVGLEVAPAFMGKQWHRSADDAVTAFFIISGFVIAHTTRQRERQGLRAYVLARSSRLYSVALPAILFAYLVDQVSKQDGGQGHRIQPRTASQHIGPQALSFALPRGVGDDETRDDEKRRDRVVSAAVPLLAHEGGRHLQPDGMPQEDGKGRQDAGGVQPDRQDRVHASTPRSGTTAALAPARATMEDSKQACPAKQTV